MARDLALQYKHTPGLHRVHVLFTSGRGMFFTFNTHENALMAYHALSSIMGMPERAVKLATVNHVHQVRGNFDVVTLES